MATITLSPQEFLQPKRVEGLVNTRLETDLQFVNLFDVVPTSETSVVYAEDLITAGADYDAGTSGKPLDLGEISRLPEIEISPVTQKQGMLQPFGFKMAVSERDIRRGTVVDDLNRAVNRGAYVMARAMDDKFISALENRTGDSITEVSGAAVWSADGATVADDIISFQEAMDVTGFRNQLSELFVEKANFYEAKKYFVDLLMSRSGDPQMVGDPDVIPNIMGTNIRKAMSASIAHGGYLGVDTRPGFKPATVYAYRDPKFGTAKNFPLVNVFQYVEQEYPHRTVTEFVADLFLAIKQPNGVCYKSTGI
jgi:hypothetical protein